MKLKPLHDHIIVKSIQEDEYTKAGLVLPQTADKEKPEKGEVLAVGPGKLLENGQRGAMSVKVGDKILFKKYSPDEFELARNEKILVVAESEVMAIIED